MDHNGQTNKVSNYAELESSFVYESIAKLAELLNTNCTVEKVHPPVLASDAEVNIVIVELVCPDGKTHTIKAYRDEALAVREFIRSLKDRPDKRY